MPLEHRNEKDLLVKNGITLCVVDVFQTGHGMPDANLGKRYIVHNGDRMIQAYTLERAEDIMADVLACPTLLTEDPDYPS